MLLPALAKAREKARSISCINNLKQNGLASALYADDNNGFVLYYGQYYPDGKLKGVLEYIQTWADNLVDKGYIAHLSKSLYCPAGQVPVWTNTSHMNETYGVVVEGAASWCFFKYNTICIYTKWWRGVNAKLLSSPSTAMNHMDSYNSAGGGQFYMVYRPDSGLTQHIQARHADSVNMDFFDGHAEAMRPVNMNAMFQASSDYHPGVWYYWDATGTLQNLTI